MNTQTATLVQYDETITRVDPGTGDRADGQRFTCREARNRFFAFGCAPWGGRTEFQGPITHEPFAFVYGCAAVIDDSPSDPMAEHKALVVHPGDQVFVKGYGWHTIELHRDGYNLNLVPVAS